ncbi:MAG: hypothetical protein U0R78_14070 [Nocardioidaceae bacterium]
MRGVGKVRVALWLHDTKLERKGKCRWLSGPGPSFTVEPMEFGACAPRWLKAKGTTSWTYAFKKALGKGSYTAYAEVTMLFGGTKERSRDFTVG